MKQIFKTLSWFAVISIGLIAGYFLLLVVYCWTPECMTTFHPEMVVTVILGGIFIAAAIYLTNN